MYYSSNFSFFLFHVNVFLLENLENAPAQVLTQLCQWLELTFIVINNLEKTEIVLQCIYKHPGIDLNEFNEFYLNDLPDKLSKERKTYRV